MPLWAILIAAALLVALIVKIATPRARHQPRTGHTMCSGCKCQWETLDGSTGVGRCFGCRDVPAREVGEFLMSRDRDWD